MDTELTHAARIQLAHSLRRRYQAASSRAKKQILNEFLAVSGYHPKYAIHLLNVAEQSAPARRGRARPTIYDDAAKQALIVLWEASDRVCGKRLKPLLRILLPSLERHGHLNLDEVIENDHRHLRQRRPYRRPQPGMSGQDAARVSTRIGLVNPNSLMLRAICSICSICSSE